MQESNHVGYWIQDSTSTTWIEFAFSEFQFRNISRFDLMKSHQNVGV